MTVVACMLLLATLGGGAVYFATSRIVPAPQTIPTTTVPAEPVRRPQSADPTTTAEDPTWAANIQAMVDAENRQFEARIAAQPMTVIIDYCVTLHGNFDGARECVDAIVERAEP